MMANSLPFDDMRQSMRLEHARANRKAPPSLHWVIVGSTLLHVATIISLIYCLIEVTKIDTAVFEAEKLDSNITGVRCKTHSK